MAKIRRYGHTDLFPTKGALNKDVFIPRLTILLFSCYRSYVMSTKKLTISDGLCAVAFGTTVATGIIAGVELEVPQDQRKHDDREVQTDGVHLIYLQA